MAKSTLVAIFEAAAHASSAIAELKDNEIASDSISRHAGNEDGESMNHLRGKKFWDVILDHNHCRDTLAYERRIEDGAIVVTIKVTAVNYHQVSRIIGKHSPVMQDLISPEIADDGLKDRAADYPLR